MKREKRLTELEKSLVKTKEIMFIKVFDHYGCGGKGYTAEEVAQIAENRPVMVVDMTSLEKALGYTCFEETSFACKKPQPQNVTGDQPRDR